ncbi:MAG: pre-peptidase C-terminal domain-containing protein, partial [Rubripirellula sp.]
MLAADVPGDDMTSAQVVTFAASDSFETSETIGNGLYGSDDVDLFRVELVEGQTLSIDVDAEYDDNGVQVSTLDSYLRIFDSTGLDLGASSYHEGYASSPNDFGYSYSDDFRTFTAQSSGVYFIGVSSQDNAGYDVSTGGSAYGGYGYGGDYRLQLLKGTAPGTSDSDYSDSDYSDSDYSDSDYSDSDYSDSDYSDSD